MKSIYLYEVKNAFEIGYIFKDKTPMISYNNMCDEIGLNDYRFGYNEDSTLLTFYYNTPNNTLGVFWSEENNHKPYFKRHIKRPSLMSLKQGSKKRKNQPQKFPTNDAHEYKKLLIAVYLCEKGLKNRSQIKKKFGVNDSQLMDIVEELLKDDIIKIIESKCIMTKEGNDFIEKNTYEYVKSLYE